MSDVETHEEVPAGTPVVLFKNTETKVIYLGAPAADTATLIAITSGDVAQLEQEGYTVNGDVETFLASQQETQEIKPVIPAINPPPVGSDAPADNVTTLGAAQPAEHDLAGVGERTSAEVAAQRTADDEADKARQQVAAAAASTSPLSPTTNSSTATSGGTTLGTIQSGVVLNATDSTATHAEGVGAEIVSLAEHWGGEVAAEVKKLLDKLFGLVHQGKVTAQPDPVAAESEPEAPTAE
jgi:hypothetical protein